MVNAGTLAARAEEIRAAPELQRLLGHIEQRARPVLERLPHIPDEKALLSRDGGVCPADGTALQFDPWSPHAHRCPRCGASYQGERHDRHWARYQHLWLAERAAELAVVAALTEAPDPAARSVEILTEYSERYLRYPNRDNVLGPSRLFFSTYLESLWLCNYLAAAVTLREVGRLDDAAARAVSQVADEAANLIGEFEEWFSNRQTWNNVALLAVAIWFEDEDLARRAIEGRTGLLAHVARGFGRDGMWHEGENYHLFALRALLVGTMWAREAGIDVFAEPSFAARVAAALRAPMLTALPDLTYPARKDSRFGVSLALPPYLELWEVGLAGLGAGEGEGEGEGLRTWGDIATWLTALYGARATASPALMEFYLHDGAESLVPRPPSRGALSWWSLLEMLPALPADAPPWTPQSELLEVQGLAVLRTGGRYASLECGLSGGGHGHADRLHLTVHAEGVPWLCDFGTGSYLTRDLLWYRSTLAHNAPRLDGRSQPWGDAMCEAFDVQQQWAWARGRYGDLTRTIVSGPDYLLDVVELDSREEHLLELPWHFAGDAPVTTPGRWRKGELADAFATGVEQFTADGGGGATVQATTGGRRLHAHFPAGVDLLRAEAPGRPVGTPGAREWFYCLRSRGRAARLITLLESVTDTPVVRAIRVKGDVIEVETGRGLHRHTAQPGGWSVDTPTGSVRLAGRRKPEPPFEPLIEIDRPTKAKAGALRLDAPPALDGSLDGFDTSDPLTLDLEDQYRRSEEAYPGPEEYSAVAYVNWTDDALYVAVDVTKAELCVRSPDAPPLLLDNEPDDIHSDGLQVYLRDSEAGEVRGFLIVPEGEDGGPVRAHVVGGATDSADAVRGAWERTETGYRVTVAVAFSGEARVHVGGEMAFDLIVNEMLPDRVRRSGQLVWSGGNGWVWLRGDRQPDTRLGVLELLG